MEEEREPYAKRDGSYVLVVPPMSDGVIQRWQREPLESGYLRLRWVEAQRLLADLDAFADTLHPPDQRLASELREILSGAPPFETS